MKVEQRIREARYRSALIAAHKALERGDRVEAIRMAQKAAQLRPDADIPLLYLSAASEPKEGLAHAVKALNINPGSREAHQSIRWLLRRIPPNQRQEAMEAASVPKELQHRLAPIEALTNRRLLSLRTGFAALAVVSFVGVWRGSQTADARQPHQAPALAEKATFTPTFTNTPTPTFTPTNTPTPTPTPTSTPTFTPTPTATPTNTPRPNVSFNYTYDPYELADEGHWIDVDLSEQTVTAYDGATPIQSFVVSTGRRYTPTLTGQFRVYVKYRYDDMAGPGYYLSDVPYVIYFYRGYSLHGTFWHDNFGTPMSHGCVNMRTTDAAWIFGFASVGTLVNVHP